MGPPKKRSNAGGALKQQLFLTPLSVSSVVGDGKRALSPIGVALSSLCDNGGSEEGTVRPGIGVPRFWGRGWGRLHGGTLGKWVIYMGERLPPCKQPAAFTWGNGWLGLGGGASGTG